MRYGLIVTLTLFMFFASFLMESGINKQRYYAQEYKRALDSGTDAATKHIKYYNDSDMDDLSYGFGEGFYDTNNIKVDKEESIKWFYKLFFGNLNIREDEVTENKLKQYIPMKALISYNNISIADRNDDWIVDKDFIIKYNNAEYLFTLSDNICELDTGIWYNISDIGLNEDTKQELLESFITAEINKFLSEREIEVGGNYYTFDTGKSTKDNNLMIVSGSSFIVLAEGLPLGSLNIYTPKKKYYAFSIGGSEITRVE